MTFDLLKTAIREIGARYAERRGYFRRLEFRFARNAYWLMFVAQATCVFMCGVIVAAGVFGIVEDLSPWIVVLNAIAAVLSGYNVVNSTRDFRRRYGQWPWLSFRPQ